mmetsp:Transcript_11927/g.28533  ORF Transcript_11927/g.28533 Transcript_11927/m.28533 type:complete len:273 (+) Transcript_11927:154-972(+)
MQQEDTSLISESGGEDSENQSSAANRSLCTSGMRLVGFALAPLGLLLLVLAALDGWKWGIGLAVVDFLVGLFLAHCFGGSKKRTVIQRSKFERLALSALPSVATFLCLYTLLVVLVHLIPASNTVSFQGVDTYGFPLRCPEGSINCVRLGNGTDTYGADGLLAPHTRGSRAEVMSVVEGWVAAHGGHVTQSTGDVFLQATFVTLLMGYVDDFAVFLHCTSTGVVVNVQSQSRIGKADLGANINRVSSLLKVLAAECNQGGKATAKCSSQCSV